VAPAAWLVLKTGGQAGRQLSLKRGNNTIGRSHECDVVVEEGTVSGEHARIRFENGQFVIYDLASLNGTFVNGRRTQRQLLMDNDEIRLGQLRLVFKKA
jgi:pSer/pThr/pTyr-binding forkhead associated (FHA) protein